MDSKEKVYTACCFEQIREIAQIELTTYLPHTIQI